eukprot:GFUD01042750.1.p1 GENE.GFUD01042750.1~~GFUD01042750.1.p1  ORF type:complete len:479 (-),score=98.34 GFUD01042750.1:72-1508(-)
MNEEAECAVCHQPIPKGRVHYGGVSCYSCRAFFRRNTQREELPICKGEGRCTITYLNRKQCSSCRYTKCIRTGMRPELVLNEDDKKRRFKKFLRKKEEEASFNAMSSPEPQNSDDDSPYERVREMPPLQPIESNAKSSTSFPRGNPFPFIFPPTLSAFNQNVYSSKLMNRCQDWKRFDSHKNKNYVNPDQDFISELRSEVKNYVEKNQYEHKISRTSSSSIQNNYLPGSQAFPLPNSLSVTVKPVPKPCMPSPPSSPEEPLPLVYSNAMKDIEAWRYFANKGFSPRNIFPHASMNSPDNLRKFFVGPDNTELYEKPRGLPTPKHQSQRPQKGYLYHPEKHLDTDLSENIFDQRPSVIMQSSYNYPRCFSPSEEDNSFKIKLEKMDYDDSETEEYEEKNLETTPISSSIVYLPENLSMRKEEDDIAEPIDEKDDLIFKYVHKKFRTHVEKDEETSQEAFPQKRKSVIFHASTTKKICVE